MKDDAKKWLVFAEDNLACARLVAAHGYYNPALQNTQQAIEKALKALVVAKDLEFLKTHSIQQLRDIIIGAALNVSLTDEQCELLDSIYLPSKYPLGSALPASDPDLDTCDQCIEIAATVVQDVRKLLETTHESGEDS